MIGHRHVGHRIQGARYLAKLTQKKLSEETGISVRFISEIETRIDHHRKDLVKRLCEALGVEYGDGR